MNGNDTFNPENMNIFKLLACDAVYTVPDYQRQYSWDNEKLDDLWNDLFDSFKNTPNENYFLGSIVVIDDQSGYHELVDGQQRITTLIILLNVIAKTFPEINSDNNGPKSGNLEQINKMINFDSTHKRLRLQVNPNYNTDFDVIVANREEGFDSCSYPSQANLKKDVPKYKFENTARYFYDKTMALYKNEGPEVLGEFIRYILYKTNIIKITCTNRAFAIKLFLVLNDRGMDLSPSDIVKSYILNEYSPQDEDHDYKCRVFTQNWNKIEKQCDDNDIKMDDFIVFYEYYKLLKNPKRQVTEELRDIIKNSNIDDLVNELKEFSDDVDKVYKSTDPIVYSLRYLPWQFYVITALACAFHVDYPQKDELFRSMQRFFYISWVAGKTLNGIKQTSFNLIAAIVKKESIESIKEMLDSFTREKHLVRDFYEALDGDVYGYGFLKPLLLSVEYNIREKTNTNFFKVDKNIHLDHVLPQNFDKKFRDEWSCIKDDEIEISKQFIGKLGNMALLLGKKNDEALNHGMDKKIKIYKGEDNANSGKTSFDTTKTIIEQYDAGNTEWTINSIKERQVYLMNLIEKLLSVSREEIILEPTTSDGEFIGSGKWYYNGQYYNNKNLVVNIVIDYIQRARFSSIEEIPEPIRNFKMHSRELIIATPPTEELNYTETVINGMRIFIQTVCTTPDTRQFLAILHQYFDFEATKTEE